MKPAIYTLGFIFLALSAHAEVVNVKLGQNVSLEAGDVAIISAGRINSAVSCNGGQAQPEPQEPQLPPSQLFESKEFGKVSGVWQGNAARLGRDLALANICVRDSFDSPVQQAQASALIHARQDCANFGYLNCDQPVRKDEQFTFRLVGEHEGQFGCVITARMIGTR